MSILFFEAFDGFAKPLKAWDKGKKILDLNRPSIVRGPIQFLSSYPIGKCAPCDVQWEKRVGYEQCPDCGGEDE
ncbi:MAG: hypothetical protein V3W44_09895 [Dehalococcoidales bacterium]